MTQKIEQRITNTVGQTFLIESAMDFNETGQLVVSTGFFISPVIGNDILSGVWFETYQQALTAANPSAYR